MQPRLRTALVLAALLVPVGYTTVCAQSKEVKEFCKGLKGKVCWLKIDVLTIQRKMTVQDVTNVYPGGEVTYRGRIGKDWTSADQTRTATAEEFAAVVRQKTKEDTPQIMPKKSKITIESVEPRDDQVKVRIKGSGKSKGSFWLKFEAKDYSIDDLQKALNHAVAESEADLAVNLKAGMTVEQVIELKGPPKTRADLGTKTILTYEDIKVTFEEGKLTGIE